MRGSGRAIRRVAHGADERFADVAAGQGHQADRRAAEPAPGLDRATPCAVLTRFEHGAVLAELTESVFDVARKMRDPASVVSW